MKMPASRSRWRDKRPSAIWRPSVARGRERAPRSLEILPLGVYYQGPAPICGKVWRFDRKPMELAVMLDTVPVEAANTVIDPRKYQRIGLDSTERMLRAAGRSSMVDPLFGPRAGLAGSSARRPIVRSSNGYGEGGDKQQAATSTPARAGGRSATASFSVTAERARAAPRRGRGSRPTLAPTQTWQTPLTPL